MKQMRIVALLLVIVLCMVPTSTFIPYEMVDNYFQLFPVACAVGIAMLVTSVGCVICKLNFKIENPDILVIVLVGYYLLRYDYQERLADWKIVYAVLLGLYWFASRLILSCCPVCRRVLCWGIAVLGSVQAMWGLLQLYGYVGSYHKMFAVTGSFYNPGPYTGYLAVVFPICLYKLLVVQNRAKYLWMIVVALLFSMIPAGMSRSAWGALVVSCLFVLSGHFQWHKRFGAYYRLHVRKTVFYVIALLMVTGIVTSLLISMKPDSAYGRLFIWKQTISIIAESPIVGYGPGSFPQVYGQKQSAYFAQGDYETWEERVAGSPVYAFNEYLQMVVEGGAILFLLGCAFIYFTFRKGMLARKYGICGGLLSLSVFAFSAYPFQVLPFGMLCVLLSSLCVSTSTENESIRLKNKVVVCIGVWFLLSVSVACAYSLKDVKSYKERAYYADLLYSNHAYQESASAYYSVYEKIKHNPRFLLRYARVLMEQKQYHEAIEILERAEKVCCDVAIINTKAFCYQQLGDYEQAETCFLQSTYRLPGRIYPYYMLAKLYADSAFYDKQKLEQMCSIVLTKEPKVYSNAVKEMRNEIRKLSIKSNFN